MSTLICSKISALKPFCPKSNYRKTYYVSSGSKQRASAITQQHAKMHMFHEIPNERTTSYPQQPDKDSAFCHRPTFSTKPKSQTEPNKCDLQKLKDSLILKNDCRSDPPLNHLVHMIYQSAYTLQHCSRWDWKKETHKKIFTASFKFPTLRGTWPHTIPKTVPTQDSKCALT